MMSYEEKKAINEVKHFKELTRYWQDRDKHWKDKIKAKIEEYEKQQKEEPDAYLCIKVLRSLLEKE